MKYILRSFAWLLFALTACAGEPPPGPTGSSTDAVACKEDFSSYFSRFAVDVELQRQTTRSPLQKLVVDVTASPEPEPVESSFSPSAADFPLFPSAALIAARGLTFESMKTDRGMKVRLYKPDTDYLVLYLFERDPCWMLVRIEDWSL